AGKLGLTGSELDNVTAGTALRIGTLADTGGIAVSAASSATVFPTRPAGYSLLHLANGGSVEGAGVLNVLNLAVEAGTGPAADNFGVNLTGANTVTSLAGNVTTSAATAGKAFTFNNATDLTVGTVDGVTGVTTNNGNITLHTHGTTMSLTEAVNAGTANV